jgi:beta-lactamase class A
VSVGDELSVLASLEPARRLSYRELCGVMLQISDNAIAGHLVRLLGIEAINAQLPELGCRATRLSVGFPPGVSDGAVRGNVTTARDMVALLELMVTEPRFGDLALAVRRGLHRNRIPLRIPNHLVVFEKSGTLHEVANDAAIIRGERVDIGLAVLTEGQADTAIAGLEIADFAGRVWSALGERTAW